MGPDTLGELAEAHNTAWRACHGTLVRQIAEAKARLDELDTVRRGHQADANKAQKKFDEWARKARRADPRIMGEGMRQKYSARIAQCKLYGQDARRARCARDDVAEIMRQIQAEVAAKEVELVYYKRYYCEIRHQYMEAIYEAEKDNPEAQAQKLEYMSASKIPSGPEEVRYYVHDRLDGTLSEVHLFYGGADAPDGDGHGHTVLHVTPEQIMLRYQRAPK